MHDFSFDDLHFTESVLSAPTFEMDVLIIFVAQLYAAPDSRPRSGHLKFRGVARSERKVTECIGAPESGAGFKPTYVLLDVTSEGADALTEYAFEGV